LPHWLLRCSDGRCVQTRQADFEDSDGVTALLAASVTGHVETIATLVARGASLDYETQLQAGTALIVSSAAGKLPSIGALVRHGANVNYETRSGLTALVVAAAKGQSKVSVPMVTGPHKRI
jgi:ankyrin repeat protein